MTDANVSNGANDSAQQQLLQMMTGYWVSKAIYVAATLGIADHVANGPVGVDALAERTETDATSLYRMLRALASVGLFSEVSPGTFGLTPMAALLQAAVPNSMRALGIMYGGEQYDAWGDLMYSVRTGKPAFEQVFRMPVFEHFRQHPEAGAVFNQAMTNWTTRVAMSLATTLDFSRFRTVVDVGGNQGTNLAAILQNHHAARGILFDLPHVVATAKEFLSAAGVNDRCTIIGGDFFHGIPAGGDVYLLSAVLHDWDDERGVAILQNCRAVMQNAAKLIVVEAVIPDGDEPSLGKWLDLHMLVMAGGRERTSKQYGSLLQSGGFEVTSVLPLTAGLNLIEATPV